MLYGLVSIQPKHEKNDTCEHCWHHRHATKMFGACFESYIVSIYGFENVHRSGFKYIR